MATPINMPQLGESVAEGTIGRWLKAVGDRVEVDESLVEIITDKVNAEVPSPVAGTIVEILVPEGQTVPVGQAIAVVDQDGVARDGGDQERTSASSQSGESSRREASSTTATGASTRATGDDGRAGERVQPYAMASDHDAGAGSDLRRTSPLVRRLAKEHGLDLSIIAGTGLGGRVTRDDVMSYLSRPGTTERQPVAALALSSAEPAATEHAGDQSDEEYLPLTPVRRQIAEHMVRSLRTAPHVTTLIEVDMSRVMRRRETARDEFRRREGVDLSPMAFVVKAVADALRAHPLLNSTWDDDRIILKKRINIGIAVGLDSGLYVPVIRDADRLSLGGLAHAAHDLIERCRSNKLTIQDVEGGTFTVNNTGALGSIASTPIINQPQAAIVTMEAIVKRPVVVDDMIAVRSMMNMCLSFDHRILDGVQASRFLQTVKQGIEGWSTGAPV